MEDFNEQLELLLNPPSPISLSLLMCQLEDFGGEQSSSSMTIQPDASISAPVMPSDKELDMTASSGMNSSDQFLTQPLYQDTMMQPPVPTEPFHLIPSYPNEPTTPSPISNHTSKENFSPVTIPAQQFGSGFANSYTVPNQPRIPMLYSCNSSSAQMGVYPTEHQVVAPRSYFGLDNMPMYTSHQTLYTLPNQYNPHLNIVENSMEHSLKATEAFLSGKVLKGPGVCISRCNECGKEFPNGQALGGHLTSHYKRNKGKKELATKKGKFKVSTSQW